MKRIKPILLAIGVSTFVLGAFSSVAKAGSSAKLPTTENTVVTDGKYVPKRADYTFSTDVHTIVEDDVVRWDTIVVYLTDAQGNTQQFYTQALPLDTADWALGEIGEIEEEDWNFDGFPDLQVCMGPMNGYGNYTYDVWLWDDTAHRFVYLDYDVPIFSPYIDSETKTIVSVWRLDDEVEIVRYKWTGGKLTEAEREQTTYREMMGE